MNNITNLIINILINIMDFIMIYFFAYNLIDKKISISKKTIFLGTICGISTGIFATYLNESFYKFIATSIIFIILKYISKKKIYELLIMYEIIFVYMIILQIILIFCVGNVPFEPSFVFLLIQTLILLIVALLHKKIPLYKIFNTIQNQILLQLLFSIGNLIFLMIIGFNSFGDINIRLDTLYTLLLFAIVLIGSCQALKRIFFYTNKVPTQLHDMKNILIGLYISTHSTEDIKIISKELNKSLEIIGIDMHIEDVQVNEHNNNILLFINQIRAKYHSQVELDSDIEFYEDNTEISRSVILYMLGVLLDNAIESGTKKDIYIKIRVVANYLLVSVANEYERKSIDDFDKMFQVRYSTKSNQLSGYGLPNLSKVVEKYSGEIQVEYSYNTQQVSNYLKITIEIKN